MVTPSHRSKSQTVVSPLFIRGAVLLSFGLAAYLIPQRAEVVKRLLEDGDHERAAEVATMIPAQELAALTEAPPAPAPIETLRSALHGHSSTDEPVATRLVGAVVKVGGAAKCLELLRQLDGEMDDKEREQVYLTAGRHALAEADPSLAATIFAAGRERGTHSMALLNEYVQACRWSNQSASALDALVKQRNSGPLSGDLQAAEISIYRELNQPAKALECVLAQLADQKQNGGYSQASVLLASEIAAQAGKMDSLLPLLNDYLQTMPAARASMKDLASGKAGTDPQWKNFTSLLAQHYQWGNKPNEAYALYSQLAATGDTKALDIVVAWTPALNRDGELLELLRAIVPVKSQPKLTHTLARLLADAGEYAEAEHHLSELQKQNPNNIQNLQDRAALYEEQSLLTEASALYEQVLKIDPGNLASRKHIADIQIAQREFRKAFAFYDNLPEKDHDATTLENYALIAEALAEYSPFNRALEIRQHRLKNPTTQDFLALARSYDLIGKTDEVIRTFRAGLSQHPSSKIIRIELANAYRGLNRYEEAVEMLARKELKTDMHAMQLYIEVKCLQEDYVGALSFLGEGMEHRFAFGPDVRLDLGHIYFNTGHLSEADALYSSVPDEPAMWPLLANARFKAGNYASAELYQRKYLASLQVPDPQAWMMLGDICKNTGRETEAHAAYAKSLELMKAKILTQESEPRKTSLTPNTIDQPKSASLR